MASTYLQVRTNAADKNAATQILAQLGTTPSAVVNMLLKQIIITGGIPFEINLNSHSDSQPKISRFKVEDVKALLNVVPDSAEEVWIFGSTVTPYCKPESDLDVCIIGHTTMQEEAKMYKAPKCAVDIITETPEGFETQSKVPGSVYKEVKDKGILVYKRGVDIKWL